MSNSAKSSWARKVFRFQSLNGAMPSGSITSRICIFAVALCLLVPPSVARATLLDGLLAYYSFSGNANDVTGNGNDGTVLGPQLTTDRFGNPNSAFNFDGVNDSIAIGAGVKPPFPLTIAAYVNPGSLTGIQQIFRNDTTNDSAFRFGAEIRLISGRLELGYYEGFSAPSNRQNATTNAALVAGEWQHVAAVFNGHRNVELYIDGVSQAFTYSSAGTGSGLSYGGGSGAIGIRDGSFPAPFLGGIDEVRIYNRALSGQEMLALKNFSASEVPEPSTLILLAIGLAGTGYRRRLFAGRYSGREGRTH